MQTADKVALWRESDLQHSDAGARGPRDPHRAAGDAGENRQHSYQINSGSGSTETQRSSFTTYTGATEDTQAPVVL
jgi:hypothetical protein